MSGSDESELPESQSDTLGSHHTPVAISQEARRGSGNPVGTGNITDDSADGPHTESIDAISRCLREAGFDHVPAYSILRDEQDYGGVDGLRRVARAIREVHGGIYRTAAKLWTEQRGAWEYFPADPIPRRVLRARDGEVRRHPRRARPARPRRGC